MGTSGGSVGGKNLKPNSEKADRLDRDVGKHLNLTNRKKDFLSLPTADDSHNDGTGPEACSPQSALAGRLCLHCC